VITVSASGDELAPLLPAPGGPRRIIGISGAPGAGKSGLAAFLVDLLGERGAHVPVDGFHLADVELERQGLLDRKGAPETFDALGCAALLGRLRSCPGETVYAPGFDRDLEQPLAGAIAVTPSAQVVVTEGNYLLVDEPRWRQVQARLDEVWHVRCDEQVRLERLVARHTEFGKGPEAAREWVERVDQANARLVEASAGRADRLLDLTRWQGGRRAVVLADADPAPQPRERRG
jgi:pantothenate kinase